MLAKKSMIRIAALFILSITFFSESVISQTFPLKINSSNRFLEDQSGHPFFFNGDAAWSLVSQVSYEDADLYLSDRASRGVNSIMVNLIEHSAADNAPNNYYNVAPFNSKVFITPNEPYFAHVDSVISRANALGIVVLLYPMYLGYQCGVSGWCSEIQSASTADMKTWGSYIGNRYKNFPNIIWVMGGDMDPTAYPGSTLSKIDTMVAAIQQADNVYSRFYTTHSERQTTAFSHWSSNWINLNSVYVTHPTTVSLSDIAYSHFPTLPFFLIEGYYEGDQYSATTQQLRAQAYWSILRGSFGNIFGNCPIWPFGAVDGGCGSDWKSQLNSPGSVSMSYFAKLFKSRNWYKLIPDKNSQVLTSGNGLGTDLAVAAYTSDSSSVFIYLPSQRNVTINPSVLSGDSIHAYWYNPSNDTTTDAGMYSKVSRSYSPQSAGDWVLLIDGKKYNFNPPSNIAISLVSPVDGTTGLTTNPTLTWNASKGATSYHLQVSTNVNFSNIVLDQSNITATSFTINALDSGTTYYWRVSVTNSSGTSAFTSGWSFSTNSVVQVPVLSSPLNGSTGVATSTTLSWNSSTGATSYHLQVSTDAGFGTTVVDQSNITSTSFVFNGLSAGTVYYWRLNVSNLQGTSPYSPVWSFTTAAAAPTASVIYSENSITSPWSDIRSWGVTRTYINTSPVNQGSTSAKIVHSSWASLQFSQGNWGSFVNIDPSPYQSLDFAINGGTTSFTVKVNCLNASGSSILTPVSFTVPANSWLIKSIPMSQLAAVPFTAIQFSAGGSTVTFYLDNISLVLKPTGPTVPSSPILLSPSNNSVNQPTVLALSWNSSSGATSYQLQLSTDSIFTTSLINDSTLTDTTRIVGGLGNSTIYFWRVLARNSVGKSTFSSSRKFSTIVGPPAIPQLNFPSNNIVNQTTPITFRWYVAQRATGYRIQIASDSTFATLTLNDSTLIDTTRTVSSFQSFVKYYWRVSSKNISGSSTFSTIWTFTTAIAPPVVPLLFLPNDNATNQPVSVQFSWYRLSNASSYRLQLSIDSTFTTLIQDQSPLTDTVLQISPLNNFVKYYWRVNASNSGGSSSFSSLRKFTTIAPVPISPRLVSPINGATNQAIAFTFRWKKSINSSSYRFQLSKDSSFTTNVSDDSTLTDTSKVISSLLYSTNYFWRVRATGVGGTSSYSSPWQFITGTIPSVPILISPLNNAFNQVTSLNLQWNSSPNALTYHIQISTDSLFATIIVNDSTLIDTSRAIASLNNGVTYFWRVRSQNSIGKSSFSPNWKFTTVAPIVPTVNYIYQEAALSSPWNDIRSWGVTRTYTNTTPVYQGSTSVKIVHSAWASLQFSQGTWGSFLNIDPTPYKSLDFAVHGGTAGVTLKVSFLNPSGGNIFTPVSFTVPANTWQTKSILMSQLANVPFVAINFTAGGSTVTFSLDNIGLVYNQNTIPAAKTMPLNKIVHADFSNNGKIDGQGISFFVDAWKRNDLRIADIGPAEGVAPNLILKKDGRIDFKDFEVFQSLWKWSQTHTVDGFIERETINNSGDIKITNPLTVNSLKNKTFRVQLPTIEKAQTVEMIINYNPLKTKIEDIVADSTGGLLWFKNIDDNSGIAVATIASTTLPLSNELLSSGLFKIIMSRFSASDDDSIRITIHSFSESSEMTANVSKKFNLQRLYIPQSYELFQNFPNPFNPFTTIRYSLPVKSIVHLEVFNSLGQSVSRLIDKELDAGFGEAVWKGGTASGMYVYRFEAVSVDNPSKRFTNVKKMVLLK